MVIYLIINNGKKFVWLDVKGVKDPLAYIRKNRLCPALIAELDNAVIEVLAQTKSFITAERMYMRYKDLLRPEYNG
jgi:hypothetical protein